MKTCDHDGVKIIFIFLISVKNWVNSRQNRACVLRLKVKIMYLMRPSVLPFLRKVAEAALRSAIPSVVDDSELKGKAKPEPSPRPVRPPPTASFPFLEVPIDKRI